jgi:hypothetical protein
VTITYGTAGAQSTHTDTITLAAPGGTAGQLAVLQVVSGHANDSIPATPSGWTLASSVSGGGGTFGASAGPRRLTFFVRVLLGSDAAPTTNIPSGTSGSAITGRVFLLSRSAGTGWRWGSAFGDDQTSGTGFSAAATSTLTFAAGDFLMLGYGVASSTDSYSAEAVTATGITFGTVTERADNAVATGNGLTVATATCTVSSGSGTQAPTVTATLGSASIGVAGVLRVREASAAITATAQTVSPPRVLASVTGMLAENIATASIYRVYGTTRTPVRAASIVAATGTDALLRVDAEQPFGVAVSYAADLTDVNGDTWTVTSGSVTSTVTADVISDAIQALGANVKIETPLDRKRDRDATTFQVGGRYVVVGRRRSPAQATITVRTESDADGDNLQTVLDNATDGIVMIRKQTVLARLDGHYAIVSDTESPTWYDGYRWWTLEAVEVEGWVDSLEAAGFTLQDIANNYTQLQDISAANATLLILAQRSF